MIPVERYKYLTDYWKRHVEEAKANLAESETYHAKWEAKLASALLAEKLASEE